MSAGWRVLLYKLSLITLNLAHNSAFSQANKWLIILFSVLKLENIIIKTFRIRKNCQSVMDKMYSQFAYTVHAWLPWQHHVFRALQMGDLQKFWGHPMKIIQDDVIICIWTGTSESINKQKNPKNLSHFDNDLHEHEFSFLSYYTVNRELKP